MSSTANPLPEVGASPKSWYIQIQMARKWLDISGALPTYHTQRQGHICFRGSPEDAVHIPRGMGEAAEATADDGGDLHPNEVPGSAVVTGPQHRILLSSRPATDRPGERSRITILDPEVSMSKPWPSFERARPAVARYPISIQHMKLY